VSGPKVTELRAGDIVRVHMTEYPDVVLSGPVEVDSQGCCRKIGPMTLVTEGKSDLPDGWWVEVTKLAPRPVYVNHEREEPVEGDIVRIPETPTRTTYVWSEDRWWAVSKGKLVVTGNMPDRLLLLVDGDTGLPAAPLQDQPKPIGDHSHPH
jgi:hypothetical protein